MATDPKETTTTLGPKEVTDAVAIVEEGDLDRLEDAAIMGVVTSGDKEAFVYEFQQGGNTVRGLTVAGIDEAANYRGGIEISHPEIDEKDTSYFVMVEARDTINKTNRWGCFEQSKKQGQKVDPFALVKAVSKAQRNALRKILPQAWQLRAISHLCGEGPQPEMGRGDMQAAVEDTGIDRRATFAMLTELMPALSARQVDKEDVAAAFRTHYGVSSRADLSEAQWAELQARLLHARNDAGGLESLVEWINPTPPPVPAADAPEEAAVPSAEAGGDIEF
jgi:hypothetical protein